MSSSFDNKGMQVGGDLTQAGGNIYLGSTHVQGSGPITINNIRLERRWTRPTPPPLLRDVIRREHALAEVSRLLQERGQLALSGRTAATAVRGMPGIGKTTLARLLALELEPRYPDGVLWLDLGPDFLSADKVQPILDQWAALALAIPPDALTSVHFESGAVRTLLSEHPHFLVLLDNVWSLDAIRPLREALPAQAHLLVTTRSGTVARGLGGARYELHVLTPEEARELMALRLGLRDIAQEVEWCDKLARGLGFHTLALDVALGRIQYEGGTPSEWRASAERIVEYVRSGEGFEDLHLEEDERDQNVERVLSYSYQRMDELAQRYFRLLGAFAPDAEFDTGSVAQLWECELGSAKGQLDGFVNAALLGRMEGGRWAQHNVVRGYALALLRRAGEHNVAASHHARIYGEAMRQADDAQRFASMQYELPQLRYAFQWAVRNELQQAGSLINACARLQIAFGLTRESLEWCEVVLPVARQRGGPMYVAYIQVCLGNALQRVALLPGEDRTRRLGQALEAYGEALSINTPDIAPFAYASTQNNRAILLNDLASLPGEDRAQRLGQALDAYSEALRFLPPDTASLDYARTQNNRALLLSEIASLSGENRAQRLGQALEAYGEALRFHTPDMASLDYAQTQSNRAFVLNEIASLPGENRAQRLGQALEAYGEALRFLGPDTGPLDYAQIQNNYAILLEDLASLPGEERAQRFGQALDAYNEALRFRTPDTAPLAYATTQNNRAALLGSLANLPGEDCAKRISQALEAYGEALRFLTPGTAPLNYATTQNNRAALLSDLASLPGENRAQRLGQALEAYGEALRFRTPDIAPLAYASTQSNRAALFGDLAGLPGENRAQRLGQALEAYSEALRFLTPDTSPLDYARTQHNRAILVWDLASLPGEDRAQRFGQALEAYDEAQRFLTPDSAPLDYVRAQNNRVSLLRELASLPGEDRVRRLGQALGAYGEALRVLPPDSAPLDYAIAQYNGALVLSELAFLSGENRMERLAESLRVAWTALTIFNRYQHHHYQEIAARHLWQLRMSCGDAFDVLWQQVHTTPPPSWLKTEDPFQAMMQQYIATIASAPDARALAEFWQQVPPALEAPLVAMMEALLFEAETAGEAAVVDVFRKRLEDLRILQAATTARNSRCTTEKVSE